jgi:thiol-disulfide isomerase/thioredoxin
MKYAHNMMKIVLAMAFIAISLNFTGPAFAAGEPPLKGAMANFTLAETALEAPDISFKTADGSVRKMSEWKGKVVLLNFWATWCAPCRHEMPALDALQADFAGDQFEVIALSSDRKGLVQVQPFFNEIGIKHLTTYLDPTLKSQRAFRVIGLPTTVLIDREGMVIGRLAGPAEWNNQDVKDLIRHFLN